MKIKKKLKILTLILVLTLLPIINAETTFLEGKNWITGVNPTGIPTGDGGEGIEITPTCNPLWICDEWSYCDSKVRSRNCVDIKGCKSNEKPPILMNCFERLPIKRIDGCVNLQELNKVIQRWKLGVFRFDIVNVVRWKWGIGC